jgi:hypothetical protein
MSMTAIQPVLFGVEQTEMSSDDYYTPAWVFERMGLTFDLDVCSPPGGVPWIPADRHFTMVDDGLAQDWYGRVWMNPPFSGTGPWIDRFISHGHGVCLVPHSRARWHAKLWRSAATFADPNSVTDPSMFKFVRDGREENIYMPVFLAAFGEECVEAISRLGRVRS